MGITFNAAAFRSSPFMAALTATDQLPETEKARLRLEAIRNHRDDMRRMQSCIRIFFNRAQASESEALYIRLHKQSPSADQASITDVNIRNSEEVLTMTCLIIEWMKIPSRSKTNAAERITFLKGLHGHCATSAVWNLWKSKHDGWIARLEAERVAFEADSPTKKGGR